MIDGQSGTSFEMYIGAGGGPARARAGAGDCEESRVLNGCRIAPGTRKVIPFIYSFLS